MHTRSIFYIATCPLLATFFVTVAGIASLPLDVRLIMYKEHPAEPLPGDLIPLLSVVAGLVWRELKHVLGRGMSGSCSFLWL